VNVILGILAAIGALTVISFAGAAAWIAFCSRQQRKERRRKFGTPLNRREKRAMAELARAFTEGDQ